jgi:hypothetical protein
LTSLAETGTSSRLAETGTSSRLAAEGTSSRLINHKNMKLYLLALSPSTSSASTNIIHWFSLEFWMHDNFLNMGIFCLDYESDPFKQAIYREFYINHIDEMMNDIQTYEVDWNLSIEDLKNELVREQYIFPVEGNYIALYNVLEPGLSKLDLFLDIYASEVFNS